MSDPFDQYRPSVPQQQQPTMVYAGANGPEIICANPNCRYVGPSRLEAKGSRLALVVLLFLCVIPGLLYALLYSGHHRLCPRCGMRHS